MKAEKFELLQHGAREIAEATVNGVRQRRQAEHEFVRDYVVKHPLQFERKGNSRYVIYCNKVNLGTRKWSHIVVNVEVYDITAKWKGAPEWKETEKCFTNAINGTRLLKSNIIGWLS